MSKQIEELSDPDMRLKPNHHELPYWVCSNLDIIVEMSIVIL